MTEITPQQQKIQVIIEKAKQAVERVQGEVSDEARDLKQQADKLAEQVKAQASEQKARARTVTLPPEAENKPIPQEVIARIESIRGDIARLQTELGTVEVRIPEGVDLQQGQKVIVEIPPNTQSTGTVTIRYIPQAAEAANARVDPASLPPVIANDVVLATYAPPIETPPATAQGTTPSLNQAQNTPVSPEVISTHPAPIQTTVTQTNLTQANITLPEEGQTQIENVLTQVRNKALSSEAPKGPVDQNTPILPTATLISNQFRVSEGQPDRQNLQSLQQNAQNMLSLGSTLDTSQLKQIKILSVIPKTASPQDIETIIGSIKPDQSASTIKTKAQDPQNIPKTASTPSPQPQAPVSPFENTPLQLAEVIGHTREGRSVIKADTIQGSFTIQSLVYAPIGSQIVMQSADINIQTLQQSPELLAKLPAPVADQILSFNLDDGLPPPVNMGLAFSQTWPALDESLSTLLQTAPQIAQAVQNTMPTASPRLVATAMFFMSALKLGNIDSWLGNKTMNALESAGKSGLMERLSGDFTRMTTPSVDSGGGQWKGITIPLMYEGQISNIQLFIKGDEHAEGANEDQNGDDKTRFVLDLELSKIGPMQLDGYLTPRSLDVILRTDHRMEATSRQDLMQIFHTAIEALDLKGGLSFQSKHAEFIKIKPAADQKGVIV